MAASEALNPAALKPHLIDLYESIRGGLYAYQEMADGAFDFDLDAAAMIGYEEGKPNSARSQTPIGANGSTIGDLYVIAFQPYDGTGDNKTLRLESCSLAEGLPLDEKILPRDKSSIAAEIMMPLVAKHLLEPNAEPIPYDVTLDLLGFEKGRNLVKKVGELGVDDARRSVDQPAAPLAFHTVEPRIINTGNMSVVPSTVERLGDPHAIFSSRPDTLQVVAFMAITDEVAVSNPDIFIGLNQAMPRRGPFLNAPKPVATSISHA